MINAMFLARANIRKKPLRTILTIIVTAFFIMLLFSGTVFILSFSKGINSLSDRLGADFILIPEGAKAKFESVVLKGEPSEFFLSADYFDKVKGIEGIENITPQLYIASLSASCCSFPVQIIGIDYDSDFLIKPWLQKKAVLKLKDNEALIGYNIDGEINSKIKFFEQELRIKEKLDQTGMGYDFSIFVNMHTAEKISKAAEKIKQIDYVCENKISGLLIKVKPGYEPVNVANRIIMNYPDAGFFPIFSKKFVGQISLNLKVISGSLLFLDAVVFILSALILIVIFSVIINERKKEFAVLRILGAAKQQLNKIVFFESLLIGSYGSIIGLLFGIAFIFSIFPMIQSKLTFPFLFPDFISFILIAFSGILLEFLSVCTAAFFSMYRILKNDSYLILRENM